MADIFTDGFEDGTFDAWTQVTQGGNVLEVQGVTKHHGSYAGHCTLGNFADRAYVYVSASQESTMYLKGSFRYAAFPANGNRCINIRASDVGSAPFLIASLGINNDGGTVKWEMGYLSGGVVTYSLLASPNPVVDTWYCLELKVVIDGAAGITTAWIDSGQILTQAGLDNNDLGNIDRWEFGVQGSGGVGSRETFWDCCITADSQSGCADTQFLLGGPQGSIVPKMMEFLMTYDD